jgi:RNA polymerase sigma-70 factor (sigma-E family)
VSTGELAIRGAWIRVFEPSRARLEQLGAWFEAEYPALLRFAYFVCGDAAAAEDLVQEAFVRLYRSTGRIGEVGFKAYVRKTILNLHRSRFRLHARESSATREQAAASEAGQFALRDEVWTALLNLSPRQRAVVALRFYEDMKETEIAATLEMSVGAVKKHTDRAMARLRTQLGDRRES